MSFEENQNDEVINAVPEDSNTEKLDENDILALAKIEALTTPTFQECSSLLPAKTTANRLQFGLHGGSSVYFNKEGSDTRFCVPGGKIGTIYLAENPLTAMKEVLQNTLSMTESDLDNYIMADVMTLKDLKIVQSSALLAQTSIKLHDLTTSSRSVTQKLAEKAHAAGMDGIEFVSNVTAQTCYAIWHNDPSGDGIATTASQTPLSRLTINGEEAADVLVYKLKIPVEE